MTAMIAGKQAATMMPIINPIVFVKLESSVCCAKDFCIFRFTFLSHATLKTIAIASTVPE